MNKQEIKNHILKTFWDNWHRNKDVGLYHNFFPQQFFDEHEDTITEIVEELISEDYFDRNYGVIITGKGVMYAEEQNLADPESLLYHQNLRHKILSVLFQFYEIKGYSEAINAIRLAEEVKTDINADRSEVDKEYQFLAEIGLVKKGYPSISREGIEYWKKHLILESFKKGFRDLENLEAVTPQQRGVKLEKIISDVLEFAGWDQEPNVKTSYEQIDVVVHRNREFYLIECKWESKSIEADVVDKLFGKLSRRAGTYGILMSMSGFSKGCVECVKYFTNQKLILLFGKNDIEEIINYPNFFESILNEKYKELVMRRNVFYK